MPLLVRPFILTWYARAEPCLFPSYNLRQKDISVVDIALHRATAVIVGVVWAWVVSRWWWPIEARRELGRALGEYVDFPAYMKSSDTNIHYSFCLNIGWLYTRLVAFNSAGESAGLAIGVEQPTERTGLLESSDSRLNESVIEFMAM